MNQTHLTRRALASRWNRSYQTLANWATKGIGPAYIRLADGTVSYALADVEEYETANIMTRN